MYDICNNTIQVPVINNTVHKHHTCTNHNAHINNLSSLDRRNFIYHCILFWNNSPMKNRTLPKTAIIRACKV